MSPTTFLINRSILRYHASNIALTSYIVASCRLMLTTVACSLRAYTTAATTIHTTPTKSRAVGSEPRAWLSQITMAQLSNIEPTSVAQRKSINHIVVSPHLCYYSSQSHPSSLQEHPPLRWCIRSAASSTAVRILLRSSLPDCGVTSIATTAPTTAPPSAESRHNDEFLIVVKCFRIHTTQ